jgi:hypothetical protein
VIDKPEQFSPLQALVSFPLILRLRLLGVMLETQALTEQDRMLAKRQETFDEWRRVRTGHLASAITLYTLLSP